MKFYTRLSTPRVAGSSPAGTARITSGKLKRFKRFAGVVGLALYALWVERKGIETDKRGHKGRPSPGLIPGLIPHSETKPPLGYQIPRFWPARDACRRLAATAFDHWLVLALAMLALGALGELARGQPGALLDLAALPR